MIERQQGTASEAGARGDQVFGRSWREVATAGVHPVGVGGTGPNLIEIPSLEKSVTFPSAV